MIDRLSRLLSRSDKEKEILDVQNLTIEDVTPPPAYDHNENRFDKEFDNDRVVPPPDLTAAFKKIDITKSDVPTTSEIIAHLKLIECLYRLKQSIGSSSGLFGINDNLISPYNLEDEVAAKLLSKLAEKRWSIYLARAVDRFYAWSSARYPKRSLNTKSPIADSGSKGDLTETRFLSQRYLRTGKLDPSFSVKQLTVDELPPIDVLLVWHAFMLNPRSYFEHCVRHGQMEMWHQELPWQHIADSIDATTFVYQPCQTAVDSFGKLIDRRWENTQEEQDKSIICPNCDTVQGVAWTDNNHWTPPLDSRYLSMRIDDMLSRGIGYCDSGFVTECIKCHQSITHAWLKVGKFYRDVELLIKHLVPMPGTIFGIKGIPQRIGSTADTNAATILSDVNGLISQGLHTELLDPCSRSCPSTTMADIRHAIDGKMRDKAYLTEVRKPRHYKLQRPERIAIRRMMSRYWENSSPFPLDLVGAIVRQGSFIEKMHNIDWLHSPALLSTVPRLITKYERFVHIMADPKHMAVPTLDVDLAWHTHQLSPQSYCHFTVQVTKQFKDHDDKIAEVDLNDAFAWTSKQYERIYKEPYSQCTCWYCEAVRESHTSAASRLFRRSAKTNNLLHDAEQNPAKSVHVSAHNAVRPTDDLKYSTDSQARAQKLEVAYATACERAEAKGRKAPRRDDYYYSDAYGYPVYIPAYAPYVGPLPYTPCYYPVVAGCMALGGGAYGNCCTGTCSGGVSAGGCATGGCAGGAGVTAAGCGGGGGGCGGCGGCGG